MYVLYVLHNDVACVARHFVDASVTVGAVWSLFHCYGMVIR